MSTGSRGRAAAESPRASACSASSTATRSSCSRATSSRIARRSASGIEGLRRTASMFARMDVSGVRTSWPTSPAKRRVASSARSVSEEELSRRASISFTPCASSSTSRPASPSGRRRDRSRVVVTPATERRSRERGASAGPASTLARITVRPMPRTEISATRRCMESMRDSSGPGVGAELDHRLGRSPKPGGSCTRDREDAPLAAACVDRREARVAARRQALVGHVALGSQHLAITDHAHEGTALAPGGRAVPACRRHPRPSGPGATSKIPGSGAGRTARGRPVPVRGSPARGRGWTAPGPRTWPPSAGRRRSARARPRPSPRPSRGP